MTEMAVIRIEFEGEWWAFEIAELIGAVDELYADTALIGTAHELFANAGQRNQDEMLLRNRARQLQSMVTDSASRSSRFLRQDAFAVEVRHGIQRPVALQVLAIKYGSDGSFDFLGLGKFSDAVASIFNSLLAHFGNAAEREKNTLAVIREKLEIAKLAGMSERDIQGYAQELLSKHDRSFRRFMETKRLQKHATTLPAPANANARKPPVYYL